MGRDWLNWTAAAAATTSGSGDGGRETNEETSTGCMCSVFQLFGNDFQVPLNHHHSSKLLPGPGNTVELKEQDNLYFRGFRIKTRLSSSSSRRDENLSTQCSSPGTKTPNLVARLMGLDLLPECTSSPSSNSTKSMRKDRRASFEDDRIRSLPETRMSISSARRSDSDYHRLSLQNNRENIKEEMKLSAKIRARRRFREHVHDENRSPGRYAKQIVKQIKETVSRTVGLDITNVNRDGIRRDENLILKKNLDEISKQSDAPSWSPKLRFFDINRSKQVTNSDSKNSRNPTVASDNHQSYNFQVTMQGSKNSCSRKDRVIRKKKEEQYVHSTAKNKANFGDKKFKKVPLYNELLPVKKHPSPHATKLPQKQTQFCSKSRQTYKQLHLKTDRKLSVVEPGGTSRCATAAAVEYRCYIEWILNRAAIVDDVTPLSFGKWHTASHPLDPSIFYYLELFHPSGAADAALVLSHRCNRKLIFQLVDELLADILKPQLDFRPWVSNSPVKPNFELVDRLCNKIAGFPAANCEVLEDIDSLIGKDLRKTQLIKQFEEESKGLVNEIEDEIMDSLVRETAATVGVGAME